jgi:hypothetical protein
MRVAGDSLSSVSRFPLSLQLEQDAKAVIEALFFVSLFPFAQRGQPLPAAFLKNARYLLMKSASGFRRPINPHGRDIRPSFPDEAIALQYAAIGPLE